MPPNNNLFKDSEILIFKVVFLLLKIIGIILIFIPLKNIRQGDQLLLMIFLNAYFLNTFLSALLIVLVCFIMT